jgi:transglutaminase-like putative cysteine protease
MHRRDFLRTGTALAVGAALPCGASANTLFAPKPGAWRNFTLTTRVEIVKPAGKAQAWVPLPSVNEADWIRPIGNTWTTNAKSAVEKTDPKYGASMLHVAWEDGEAAPVAEVVSRFATRDRSINLAGPGSRHELSAADRELYTTPTELIPTDGIVKLTAERIVAGAPNEVEKAHRIYEWIVDNTFRKARTRGCGIGDIAAMLKTGDLGGKCADLNALYVGLARASGLPARDVYGIRVAPSQFGYKSLGAGSEVVSKAQHCRAEVFLTGFGWVPVDPADVRKVVLEEPPGNLALNDAKVRAARTALFGSWEMNWLAYNFAHDVDLPGSSGPKVGFLMYPQADVGDERLDSLEPDAFKYTIVARETEA